MYPFVVFFGINNHNHSIVFCGVIVCEETYVQLLKQLFSTMGWKSPTFGITDGNLRMKNIIIRVFLEAHHILCVRHLIWNACLNVGNNQFVKRFKQYMLGGSNNLLRVSFPHNILNQVNDLASKNSTTNKIIGKQETQSKLCEQGRDI